MEGACYLGLLLNWRMFSERLLLSATADVDYLTA